MKKKTLVALGVLGVLGAANAADVTIYGRIDEGLVYTDRNADYDGVDNDTFELSSGNYTGSRWGIKGNEDLGNGLQVGFVLEGGFNADTGTLSSDNTLFNRESTVHVKGRFGELGFGRVGILELDGGSYGFGDRFSPMGTGVGDMGNQHSIWGAGIDSRYSNMITYVTPEFFGAKVYAQYSFGDGTGDEGKTTTNRYAGLGATYDNGPLSLALVVDMVNNASSEYTKELNDTYRVVLGGSYDFGIVKPYLAAGYFKDGKVTDVAGVHDLAGDGLRAGSYGTDSTDYTYLEGYYDGWGAIISANVPAFGGDFAVELGYMDADLQGFPYDKGEASGYDLERWMIAGSYAYPLSTRTKIYGFAGYVYDSVDSKDKALDRDPAVAQIGAGIVHYF